MSLSSIFEIGKRSLLTYQSAINTTAGNISNVNNENYARRRADLSSLSPGIFGIGINAEQGVRLRQQYVEHQLWYENQDFGRYETSEMILSQVENVFAEDTEAGLSNLIDEFWQSWNDLANDPESDAMRAIVKDKAVVMTNSFNRIHTDLKNMQDNIAPDIQAKVDEINQKTNKLADINKQIRVNSSPGLLDERDKLITELSKIVNIKVKEKDNGEVSIFVDGLILISDEVVNEITTDITIENGNHRINIKYKDFDKTINVKSGELYGLLDNHNNKIPEYLQELDLLAKNIAENVNAVHRTGFNLGGITNVDFFESGISGAADFRVAPAVVNDPTLIATRAAGEGEGSGSIAQAISDLQFSGIVNGSTVSDFYNSMLSDIGSSLQEAEFLHQSQQLIIQNLQNQKEAVTGVSLDEEMTKLIQFEQSYEAAARIVTTVDEMIQTVLSLK